MLQTAEPRSRRLPGAPQRPPHRPLGPQGPRTSAAKALGPDIHGIGPAPGGPRGNTPTSQHLSAVVKTSAPRPPVPVFCRPFSRGRREGSSQARSLRQAGDSGRDGPGPPPPVTCEDSNPDLVVVVSKDHSLGRHVSQRSHRTDRSREKPEPGARGPGARSLWRARERERPGSASRSGKEGEAAECSAACASERPGPERASPRGDGGAESGRGTPTSGRRRRAAGGGRGGYPGRPRGGVGARRKRLVPLCRAPDPARLAGRRLKGKESTSSRDCGGGLGPGAELHRESWNSWRVRGGVSARLRSAGSGKEPAQPNWTGERSWARE